MKILISGASGLIGKAVSSFLQTKGHEVVKLSRVEENGSLLWDPERGVLDPDVFIGVDAVINLSGENISNGRWTDQKKKAILESRVAATTLIAQTIAKLKEPPKVFINASADGYYGDQGDKIVDESSPKGGGFLADVCAQWEAAAEPARNRGVRIVFLRTGVVLSKEGGALKKMVVPFRWGIGGKIGSGEQYMSWVSLNEMVHIIDFILRNEQLEGPVNAVAPCPVTNAEFTKVLGKALNRPAFLPMPAFAARLAFGEMADELLLSSLRVHPSKLQKFGYTYRDPSLEQFLRRELKK